MLLDLSIALVWSEDAFLGKTLQKKIVQGKERGVGNVLFSKTGYWKEKWVFLNPH